MYRFSPDATSTFLGAAPAPGDAVRLDMMALYTLVHLTAFAVVGTAATALATLFPALRRRALALSGIVFALLSSGVLTADQLVAAGVFQRAGLELVTLSNVVAAVTMGWFVTTTLDSSSEAGTELEEVRSGEIPDGPDGQDGQLLEEAFEVVSPD